MTKKEVTKLPPDEFDSVLEVLKNPPPPTDKMKELIKYSTEDSWSVDRNNES
ncbi:hypothetical protein ACN08P_23310 (plasmid) [Photobacterium leiognathi subsp. mandapamensis]|uniref:hypothetical protein n=1 Tax=Photobacterium leiognathi TaxID=553611 RepID=UPI003AF3582A